MMKMMKMMSRTTYNCFVKLTGNVQMSFIKI